MSREIKRGDIVYLNNLGYDVLRKYRPNLMGKIYHPDTVFKVILRLTKQIQVQIINKNPSTYISDSIFLRENEFFIKHLLYPDE